MLPAGKMSSWHSSFQVNLCNEMGRALQICKTTGKGTFKRAARLGLDFSVLQERIMVAASLGKSHSPSLQKKLLVRQDSQHFLQEWRASLLSKWQAVNSSWLQPQWQLWKVCCGKGQRPQRSRPKGDLFVSKKHTLTCCGHCWSLCPLPLMASSRHGLPCLTCSQASPESSAYAMRDDTDDCSSVVLPTWLNQTNQITPGDSHQCSNKSQTGVALAHLVGESKAQNGSPQDIRPLFSQDSLF